MTTDLVTLPDQQFVACSLRELPNAQRNVIDWCRAKIYALSLELKEQRANAAEAKRMLWRNRWPDVIRRTARQMIYYAKIKKALEAGYLIVPNFDIDVIAVRVGRNTPVEETDVKQATPDILPPGQGRYVDDTLRGHTTSEQYIDSYSKQERTRTYFHPTTYDTKLDFPAALVKPAILAATNQALARKLFDRIGVVRHPKRSDPIVVGQIINPKERSSWQLRHNPRCVTFFIAWWLDTKDL